MARILVGWELGAGLGHVTRLRKIGRALAERGHHPIFAVRNLVESWSVLKDDGFTVVQAPMPNASPRSVKSPWRAAGLADIFIMQGMDRPGDIYPVVMAWQHLFDLYKPALAISDYSPMMCLAAYGSIPMVVIGDGFTVPPNHLPEIPKIRPSVDETAPQEDVVAAMAQVQQRRGRPAPESFSRLFECESTWVCTFPELDPYRNHRENQAVGPFDAPPTPLPMPKENRFFAYLGTDYKKFKIASQGISEIGIPGEVYIRRAAPGTVKVFTDNGIQVHDRPVSMVDTLRNCSVIVHQGGIGTTEVSMAIGRPQVVLTTHLEQNLNGGAVERQGVGVRVTGDYEPGAIREAVHKVLDEPSFAKRAQIVANALHKRNYVDNVPRIADACCRIISIGRAEPVL
jgi:hypothetical protein